MGQKNRAPVCCIGARVWPPRTGLNMPRVICRHKGELFFWSFKNVLYICPDLSNLSHIDSQQEASPARLKSSRVLVRVGSDKSLRRPGRLYFFCRTNGISKVNVKDSIPTFTRYQVMKYLSVLCSLGLAGRDKEGNYYIRNIRTAAKRLGIQGHVSGRINKDMVNDDKTWTDYVMGHAVLGYVGNLRSGRSKKRAACYTAHICQGQGDLFDFKKTRVDSSVDSQATALRGIGRRYRVSDATASRWRRRGQKAGYQVKRHLSFVRELGEAVDTASLRYYNEDGKVMVVIGKCLYIEQPAMLFAV